jgi:hypothetical protein
MLCMALAVPPSADAARPLQVTRALDWLHAQQGADGRFQDAAYTPWAVVAIAAAGEDPDGAAWAPAGKSPMDFLQSIDLAAYSAAAGSTSNAPAYYAKMILAYVAAGRRSSISSAGSKRIDLTDKLLSYRRADGRVCPTAASDYIGAVNATIWAIIALEAAGTNAGAQADALAWLKGQQLSDGGFANMAKDGPGTPVSDVDDTAAAVEALIGGGMSPGSGVVAEARAYLQAAQRSDGGFSSARSGGYTYSESTAWALQAILALGESPAGSAWTKGGSTPQSALRGLQAPTGAMYHRKGVVSTAMLSTTQSLVALAGKSFSSFPRGGSSWVSPFAAAPTITRLKPANGARLAGTAVVVTAGYRDGAGGTGIAASSVRLTVDGRDVTKQARVTASSLSIRLTGAARGSHTIKVEVRDRAGNARSATSKVTTGATSASGGSTGSGAPAQDGASSAAGEGSAAQPSASSDGDGNPAAGTAAADLGSEEAGGGAGAASTLPAAPFPSAGETTGPSETASSTVEATGSAVGSTSPPGSMTEAQARERRYAALLFALGGVPTAVGFWFAARRQRRWRRSIGADPPALKTPPQR